MSFESNRFLTGNFTVADAEAWIAAAELARQGILAPPPDPDPAAKTQTPTIVGDPAPAVPPFVPSCLSASVPEPIMHPILRSHRRPGGPTDEALDPTQPIPSLVEEDVLADEMCIDDAPQLLKSLPIMQQRVLIELCTGRSMRQAARTCGINRATIQRWMHHDARFIAAYNQTIEFQQKEAAIRMAGMLPKSMDNLNEEVQHGDMKASLFVINNATKIPHGSLSPKKIAKRIRRREQHLEEFLNSPDDVSHPSPACPEPSRGDQLPALSCVEVPARSCVEVLDCSPALAPAQEKGEEPPAGETASPAAPVPESGTA